MVNSVIDRHLHPTHTVLHLHLGILERHGSLRQQRQCVVIVHVTWGVATRPKGRDSHRRQQHGASVGLAHSTGCSLHLRAILDPVCP